MSKVIFKFVPVLGVLGLFALGFQNCSKVGFNQVSSASNSSDSVSGVGDPQAQPPPSTAVCNPFSTASTGAANCNVNQAFVGNLYVQPRSSLQPAMHGGSTIEAGATSIAGYLANPSWVAGSSVNGVFTPYTIIMSSINTLGNPFANGFQTDTGANITIPDVAGMPDSVVEWFALDLKANFHLAPGDSAGNYQFALIADDGAQLLYQPSASSGYVSLVDNETPTSVVNPGGYLPGTQYPRMGCSAVFNNAASIAAVPMTATSAFPMEVKYYQGPLGLSFVLMYRKVPAAGANDAYCETDVNSDPGTKSTVVKASPVLDPSQLAARGWQIVSSANLGNP